MIILLYFKGGGFENGMAAAPGRVPTSLSALQITNPTLDIHVCVHVNPSYVCIIYTQQTRGVGPMLGWCWASVVDDGPTSAQQLANASCLLGIYISIFIPWEYSQGCSPPYTDWRADPKFRVGGGEVSIKFGGCFTICVLFGCEQLFLSIPPFYISKCIILQKYIIQCFELFMCVTVIYKRYLKAIIQTSISNYEKEKNTISHTQNLKQHRVNVWRLLYAISSRRLWRCASIGTTDTDIVW